VSNNKINAIIFDVDGAVFKTHDKSRNYLWSQSVKEGLYLTSKYFLFIFSEKLDSIIRYKITLERHLNTIFQEILFKHLGITHSSISIIGSLMINHLNQEILDLVKSLKIPFYLAANEEVLCTKYILDTSLLLFQRMFCIL
jgi:hypothetical protein